MILHKESTPFSAELKPSKKLQHLLVLIHGIALVASFANSLPLLIKLVVALCIGLNFKFTFPKFQQEQRKIKYSEKLGWQIADSDEFKSITVLPTTVVTPYVVFLHIDKQKPWLIPYDAMPDDVFRHFIAKLKMTVA